MPLTSTTVSPLEKLFAFLTLITYRIGEVFIHLSSEETQEYLESAKSKLQEEVKLLESQSGEVKALLGDLKVKLYAKFGNNINLEAEEE
ncbi:Prefoldin subunit 4 [Porites harrisoni]